MRIKSPLLIKLAGRLGYVVMSSIFLTVKKDLQYAAENPYLTTGQPTGQQSGQQRYLYSLWHDSAVMATFLGKRRQTVALTSRHRDGSFVESILAPAGIRTVRGSTGRGGGQAARELILASKDHDIVLVPDGPRGPRREMSRGIVYLASRTGNPIIPAAFACDRYWEIKSSWTSHTIPRPFSTVVMTAGDPIHVPSNLSPDDLDDYVLLTQRAMDDVQATADRSVSQSHDLAAEVRQVRDEEPRAAA